ncbi:MAG: hypothetical protein J7647_00910 [Cyanobacteria bacterium SBLK]|nr:hypothetical protein [Cyanobacteria bacterium SBLK]
MVSKKSRSLAIGLGVVSTLALAAVPAKAQIQVTGGNVSGNAAYFVPTATGGDIKPFDLQVQSLTIVSPNGTLTNPAFVPTALGGFTDTDGSNSVTNGDTGLIRGRLSGIGFDVNGFAVPFSQVDTILGYNINTFSSDATIGGSLLTVDSSQYFLSNLYGSATSTNLTLVPGSMEIGALDADLKTGLIALPNTLKFSDGSGSNLVVDVFDLSRTIEFEFKGTNAEFASTIIKEDATSDTDTETVDLDFSDGSGRFVGEVDSFAIKTTDSNTLLSLSGSGLNSTVDIKLATTQSTLPDAPTGTLNGNSVSNPTLKTTDNVTANDPTPTIDYTVTGKATGIFGFLTSGVGANFAGFIDPTTGQTVTYDFAQSFTDANNDITTFNSAGELTSGTAAIALSIGQTFDPTATSVSNISTAQTNIVSTANTVAVSNSSFTTINIVNTITVGDFSFNFSNSTIDLSSIFNNDGTATNEALDNEDVEQEIFFKDLVNSILDELELSGFVTAFSTEIGGSDTTYELLNAPLFSFVFTSGRRGRGRVKVRLVQRGGDRYVLALRGGSRRLRARRGRRRGRRELGVAIGGKLFVGPTSRIFPTLVGTRDLTPEEIQSVYDDLNAEEGDIDDDTDVDVDDDTDTDVDGDDDDDDTDVDDDDDDDTDVDGDDDDDTDVDDDDDDDDTDVDDDDNGDDTSVDDTDGDVQIFQGLPTLDNQLQ